MNKQSVTIIKPTTGLRLVDLNEVWKFRELLWTFLERDVKVKYKQALLGGLWAVLKPLATMVVFTFFFGKIAKIPSDGIPYPIFSYSGLLLWTYFSGAVAMASGCVVGNSGIISKVYFPRIIFPLSKTLVGLVDYAIATVILFALMFYYRFSLQPGILLVPLIVLISWLLASGVGFWISAANAIFRDAGYVSGFLLRMWIYATPVIYPLSVAGRFKWIVLANPMTGLVEAHRAAFLGTEINFVAILISIGLTAIIFFSGLLFFKYLERKFVDLL